MQDDNKLILRTFSDKDFIKLEEEYRKLLGALGIDFNRSRFHKHFKDYATITKQIENSSDKVVPEKYIAEYRHGTYDLSQLREIYEAVKDYPDKQILKDKLVKLNKGTTSPSSETSDNSIARDTQFELKLFSDYKESGIKCFLREPRPDIEIKGSNYSFGIECKRIFSDNDSKVSLRVGEARDQLKQYLGNDREKIGIIAVDVSRKLTKGNTYLRTKSADAASARLSYELDIFRNRFARFWTPQRIGDERIVAVLLYASVYSYLEDKAIPAHASQVLVQNLYSTPYSKLMFNHAIKDVFEPLSVNKTGKLNIVNEQ